MDQKIYIIFLYLPQDKGQIFMSIFQINIKNRLVKENFNLGYFNMKSHFSFQPRNNQTII